MFDLVQLLDFPHLTHPLDVLLNKMLVYSVHSFLLIARYASVGSTLLALRNQEALKGGLALLVVAILLLFVLIVIFHFLKSEIITARALDANTNYSF